MSPKLSPLVQVDLDGRRVTIQVAGALTTVSQQALHPLIRRAGVLAPGLLVTVDLTGLSRIEADGLRLLEDVVADLERTGRGRAVQLVLPRTVPEGTAGVLAAAGSSARGGAVHSRPGWSSDPVWEVAA